MQRDAGSASIRAQSKAHSLRRHSPARRHNCAWRATGDAEDYGLRAGQRGGAARGSAKAKMPWIGWIWRPWQGGETKGCPPGTEGRGRGPLSSCGTLWRQRHRHPHPLSPLYPPASSQRAFHGFFSQFFSFPPTKSSAYLSHPAEPLARAAWLGRGGRSYAGVTAAESLHLAADRVCSGLGVSKHAQPSRRAKFQTALGRPTEGRGGKLQPRTPPRPLPSVTQTR